MAERMDEEIETWMIVFPICFRKIRTFFSTSDPVLKPCRRFVQYWPEFEFRPPSVARISELIEYLRSRSWNCSVCPWKKKMFKRGGDDWYVPLHTKCISQIKIGATKFPDSNPHWHEVSRHTKTLGCNKSRQQSWPRFIFFSQGRGYYLLIFQFLLSGASEIIENMPTMFQYSTGVSYATLAVGGHDRKRLLLNKITHKGAERSW